MTPDASTSHALLTPDQLEAALRGIGRERYHNLHPLHRLMHTGGCTRGQLQAWALNRYLYQAAIPIKDASIIARMEDPALRREWRRRLEDHDGSTGDLGGIAKWIALAEGLGLDRTMVVSGRAALPATRFAVGAYIAFVRERTLLEAIASSLTELFSPDAIGERVAGMLAHYDFIGPGTLAYFEKRGEQARRDTDFALGYVREHACTPETQAAVLAALRTKCDILWAMSDALYAAYIDPGMPPPGAFVPEEP